MDDEKMKKRLLALVMTLVLLMSASAVAFSASAATQNELVEILLNDPDLGQYTHVTAAVVNQIDNFNFTSEQCDYLKTKYYEFKELVLKREAFNSETAHEYDPETVEEAFHFINDVLANLGYTCAYVDKARPLHAGDIIFQVYDANGFIVFEYDGDYVQFTDVAEEPSNVGAYIALAGGILVLSVALFFAIKGKKRLDAVVA